MPDTNINLKMYKVEDLVKLTGCSKSHINKLIGEGAIKAVRFGTTHRVLESDFIDFIKRGGTQRDVYFNPRT